MQTQLQWLFGKQLRTFGQLIYFLAGVESPRLSVPFLRQFPFAKHESHKPALSANIVSVHLRFHWVEVRKIRYQFGFGDDGPLKPVPCLYFTACGCQILYSHYMFNLTQWHPPFTLIRIGLMTAVRCVLRLRRGGCLWGGLPCSAHVWIASGTTGKSPSFPRGDMSVPCTRKGNCLAARFCLLALLAIARQVYWGGEQPGTSVAILLDYVEWVMNCNRSMIGFLPSTTVRLILVGKKALHIKRNPATVSDHELEVSPSNPHLVSRLCSWVGWGSLDIAAWRGHMCLDPCTWTASKYVWPGM